VIDPVGDPYGPIYLDPASGRDHIYVIRSDVGHTKIGVTKNPQARLNALQSGNPHKLRFVRCMPLTDDGCDAYRIEGLLHRLLAEKRMVGEWFDVTDLEIDLAYEVAQLSAEIFKDNDPRASRPPIWVQEVE
jgi:hypothetical protein